MPTKYANVIIEVDDRSLIELGAEMQQVAINLSKLKIGTKEWIAENQKLGALKNKFNEVTMAAQKLQGVVEKVAAPEQLRAFAKLGAGMVGAFSAASGSLKLLGIQSEAFDEMTAKATTLMAVMGGLNQVAETFSKENIKGLKAIGSGFGTLVTTVKTASVGMKAALLSTGIGALVVGVGLLIANWDKLSAMINKTAKKEKEAEDARRAAAEAGIKTTKEFGTYIDKNIEIGQKELEQTGNSRKLRRAELDDVKNKLNLVEQERDQNQKLLDDKREEIRLQQKVTEDLKAKVKNEEWWNKTFKIGTEELKARKAEYEKEKAILGKLADERTEIQLQLEGQAVILEKTGKELLATAQYNYDNAEAVDAVNEKLRKQQDAVTAINGLADAERQTYLANYNALQLQINAIKLKEDAWAKYNQDAIDALQAQQQALTNAENERVKQYKLAQKQLLIDIEILNIQREYAITLAQVTYDYSALINSANELLNIQTESSKTLEDNVDAAKGFVEAYNKLAKKRQELINFDEEGKRLFIEQNQELLEEVGSYQGMVDASKELIIKREILDNLGKGSIRANEKILDFYANELTYFTIVEKATQAKLKHEIEIIEQKKVIAALELEEKLDLAAINNVEKNRLIGLLEEKQLQLTSTKNLEDRKKLLDEIAGIESEIISINETLSAAQADIISAKAQQISADNEILKKNDEINASVGAIVEKEKEVTAEVENQSRAYAELQAWLGKYADEIEAVRQALFNSIEFIAALQDRKAADAQARIDDYTSQLDELASAEESHKQRLLDLENELKDANGTRYDELMMRIAEENAAYTETGELQKQIAKDIEAEENKKLAADARAAKWRKANSIIEATIAGALAVIKALPNVFLAVATGVAAAASIAIIAAQKTPPIPEGFAEGGFTGEGGKYEVAGTVHKGEYIVPAHVVKSSEAQPLIQSLEMQRTKGYANGGLVPDINGSTSGMIDYDRMAMAFYNAIAAMPNPVVSVVKITQAQQEVLLTKTQAGLTR